jgi:hypothetical protein
MSDVRGRTPAMVFVVRSTPELRHTHASQGVQTGLCAVLIAFPGISFQYPVTRVCGCRAGHGQLATDK